MNQNTTIKTRAVHVPNEMQQAQNRFAVAIKKHTENPNQQTQQELEAAQEALYKIEDLYREGRKLRLAHTAARARRPA
jgi:hypothetical protein